MACNDGPQDAAIMIGFLRHSSVRNSLAGSSVGDSPHVLVSSCYVSKHVICQ